MRESNAMASMSRLLRVITSCMAWRWGIRGTRKWICGSAVSVLERLQQDGDTITLGRLLGVGIEEKAERSLGYRSWASTLACERVVSRVSDLQIQTPQTNRTPSRGVSISQSARGTESRHISRLARLERAKLLVRRTHAHTLRLPLPSPT